MRISVLRHAVITPFCLAILAVTAREGAGAQLSLSPYAGGIFWPKEIGLKDDAVYGARLAFLAVRWLGVEGTYGRVDAETDFGPEFWRPGTDRTYQTSMEHLGADFFVNLTPSRRLSPYASLGWTQLEYDSERANTVTGGTPYVFRGWECGVGMKVRLARAEGFDTQLRFDARGAFTKLVQWFPDFESRQPSVLVTAGLQFMFGENTADADRDGVRDRQDLCPDTPRDLPVNAFGCPLDGDLDGIPDRYDKCDHTPPGALVDARGCPSDGDADGVFDGIDACSGTPAGAVVDAGGCPRDSDGDGVYDGLDACAGTPLGATVDARGCALDSDGDGVPDGIDTCVNTPPYLRVDEKGCAIEETRVETELFDVGVVRRNILFASGAATIQPESYGILDEIGGVLARWPELRIEIGGHTDAVGAEEQNRLLSENRGKAVLEYLLGRYRELSAGQFAVVGYGESRPIATNDTEEGRARNRRVEFTVLNREAIRREIERRRFLEK
jgi:outer membrane protein OmpA-like peptidoglycan-associated protein